MIDCICMHVCMYVCLRSSLLNVNVRCPSSYLRYFSWNLSQFLGAVLKNKTCEVSVLTMQVM